MRNFYYTLLVLLITASNAFAQKQKLVSVRLEWAGFNVQTFVAVDCSKFNDMFKKVTENRLIRDRSGTYVFELATKSFISSPDTQNIDVRGVITFNYRNKRIKYCFDRFGLFYGKGNFYTNKKLMDIILKYAGPKQ